VGRSRVGEIAFERATALVWRRVLIEALGRNSFRPEIKDLFREVLDTNLEANGCRRITVQLNHKMANLKSTRIKTGELKCLIDNLSIFNIRVL